MFRLTLFLFVTIGLSFTSCKDHNAATKDETSEAKEDIGIPDDFYAFYDTFHTDTSFQMSRISFPLMGRKLIEEVGGSEKYNYPKSEWILHKPYDDMDGTFQRSFQAFKGIVTETIVAGGGQFTMKRTFAKLADDWNLIYYEPMGMY